MGKEFQLVAGHLALDFVNTLDYRYDRERLIDLLPSYDRFLAFAVQNGILTGQQAKKLLAGTSERVARRTLEEVIELREALYFLLLSIATGQTPAQSHLKTFNRFLSAMRVPEIILWQKPDFIRSCCDLAANPEGPLWPIIDAGAGLLTSPDRYHLRECSEKSCRWLFLDRSKNHSRRWCDMKLCGNRSKAQRFYARQHSEQ